MWAGYFYGIQNEILDDQNLFLVPNQDDLCNGTMGMANFDETRRQNCRWNFTNSDAARGWADYVVMEVAQEESVSGVFLDNAETVHCDQDGNTIFTCHELFLINRIGSNAS